MFVSVSLTRRLQKFSASAQSGFALLQSRGHSSSTWEYYHLSSLLMTTRCRIHVIATADSTRVSAIAAPTFANY